MSNAKTSFIPKTNLTNQRPQKNEENQQVRFRIKTPFKLINKCDPYNGAFQQKSKIVSANLYVDESEKRRKISEQLQILKTLQETSRSFHRVITYEDGYSYEGEYKESKDGIIREGNGVLKYQDEIIYEGQFRNNSFHGNGICKQDNKLYNLLDWRRKDQKQIRGIFENGILIQEQPVLN